MDRRPVEPLVLAILAIVALAVAAATLPSATESAGSGDGSLVEGSGEGWLIPTPEPRAEQPIDPPTLGWLLAAVLILAGVAVLLYLVFYRRAAIGRIAAIAAVFALVALVFWLASHLDLTAGGRPGWTGSALGDLETASENPTPRATPVLLLVLVGVVLLGAVVLVRRGTPRAIFGGFGDAPEPSAEAEAVGRVAREAADRIEHTTDVENEIYRAWREMTAHLDVQQPESSTPGEFAAAATASGMDPDDVGALTRLFEDVRYGGDEPTASMEWRALAILRRIEATYAAEESHS